MKCSNCGKTFEARESIFVVTIHIQKGVIIPDGVRVVADTVEKPSYLHVTCKKEWWQTLGTEELARKVKED